MKLGAAVWCFTHPHYGPPYEGAIDAVAELGVTGIEMIANTTQDLTAYYTAEKCKELRKRIEGHGMEVSEFVLYSDVVSGFLSEDEHVRKQTLGTFARGLEVAKLLGANMVNTVSNWPEEIKAPIPYMPSYIHPASNGYSKFNPKQVMDIPAGFDAPATWDRYMDSLKAVVALCEQHEMRFVLEGHANVLAGTTDAMLRAFDRIPSDSFGTNFDAAWQLMQREYLPWSVLKLGNKIFHVHIRDADGLIDYTLPVGQGIIDWRGFVGALKQVGYDGYLSLELAGLVEQKRYARESIAYMRAILQEADAAERSGCQ